MAFDWTNDAIERLRALFETDNSMSQIAAAIGGGLTKNAVIGKLHRLGLFRGKPVARPQKPRNRRTYRQSHITPPVMEVIPMPTERVEDGDIPTRCTLMGLTNNTCRYPTGTPGRDDFFYCGDPTADCDRGRPYCAEHHAVAFSGKPLRGAPFIPRRAA
jgi:GcrA cell cycle regulator